VLFELAGEANRTGSSEAVGLLRALGGVLGLLDRDAWAFLRGGVPEGWSPERIEQMIAARTAAKQARNYGEADRIRDDLAAAGIALEDGPQGTTWRRG